MWHGWIAPVLLLAAGSGAAERLPALLAEVRRTGSGDRACLEELGWLTSVSADEAARRYRQIRRLDSDAVAHRLLSSLLAYRQKPSAPAFAALRAAHLEAGATGATAEDVCRCVYFEGDRETKVGVLTSVPPIAVGSFWAGRVLHEDYRPGPAVDHYRRAREADPADPRTRLLGAIALLELRRAAEAVDVLQGIPDGWAPKTVSYWRARALLADGRAGEAQALLEPLKEGWTPEPTMPDAYTDSAPVQPPTPPHCVLGEALAAEGDEAGARALLAKNENCRFELGRLELKAGRPFEALLAFDGDFQADRLDLLQALAGLQSCEWARSELEGYEASCRSDPVTRECARLEEARSSVTLACPASAAERANGDPALEARLEEPRLVPFEERPIAPQWRWPGRRGDRPRSAKGHPGLPEHALVSLSPVGRRMFAVSVSQDVDPRGEVSAGGYWLHLSSDRGRSWSGPYYLGFAERFPYVVQWRSRVPAFEGDRLNLEVERREVDESSITFPPIALRAKNVAKDLYLSLDLAAVRRDTDGDGLTDLLEEKLLLDPRSADSDGDGIADGDDPLPLQPRTSAPPSDVTEVLAAVLPMAFGRTGDRGPTGARTLFVAAAGLVIPEVAGTRTVVLPPELGERYTQRFGATYWMDLPDVAFDERRQRALIRYHFHWAGGSLLAERKGGRWLVTRKSSWIT